MDKMTRVRYKLVNNKFVTTQSFLGNNGTLLKVEVTTDNPTVSLVTSSDTGDTVVVSKPCTNVSKGKVLGKSLLKEYGVSFYEEARKRIVS
jgi:hypothetical protein